MQDSESNYPLQQPRKNGHHRPPDDDQFEDEEETPPRNRVGARFIAPSSRSTPTLPPNRLKNSLLSGVIAGVLCIGQSIIITLANAPTYHAYETTKDATVKNALAFTIFGYGIMTFFISMLICLGTGFIVGRMVVKRRLAFLAGFVAGILVYVVSFFINYIPNYPGSNVSSGSSGGGVGAATGGIFLVIVFVIVWGVVGGLVSLVGGWLATRRHPYYMG